ncbi:MAG: ankyrin repeat domain-containing protein [Flavobacterium sp.]
MKNKYIALILVLIFITSCKKDQKLDNLKSDNESTLVLKDSLINDSNIDDYIAKIDGFDYTQLGINCKDNNLEEVEKIISKGADIEIAKKNDIYEFDALYVAIENKNLKIVEFLINKKAKINQIYDEEGLTPLVLACKLNDIEIVKLLLKNGANVDGVKLAETDYTLIPLQVAIENTNINIAKLLLNSGANQNLTDTNGIALKSIAFKKGEEWQKIFKSDSNTDQIFKGVYNCEVKNRDNIVTIFNINIKSIDNILVKINEGGSKENYSNIIGDKVSDNKIKILYNKNYEDEMGVIFIEKRERHFYISGNPIYFINPGNKEYEIKKIE